MATDHGAFFGSFALRLMHSYEEQTWLPNDINIVVPKHRGGATHDIIVKQGYIPKPQHTDFFFTENTDHFVVFLKPGLNNHALTISESKRSSILGVIFNCPTTATMITITHQKLYCFYPKMTLALRAVSGLQPVSEEHASKIKQRSFELQHDTTNWNKPCGEFCPGIGRRVKNLRGIRVWCWNPQEQEETDVENDRIIWRIGIRCRNIFCSWYRHQSFH
jgi:hypothetical protein